MRNEDSKEKWERDSLHDKVLSFFFSAARKGVDYVEGVRGVDASAETDGFFDVAFVQGQASGGQAGHFGVGVDVTLLCAVDFFVVFVRLFQVSMGEAPIAFFEAVVHAGVINGEVFEGVIETRMGVGETGRVDGHFQGGFE